MIKKIIVVVLVSILILFILLYNNYSIQPEQNDSIKFFHFNLVKNNDLIEFPVDSIFKMYTEEENYILNGTHKIYGRILIELDENNQSVYDELKNTDQKTVVIYPIFTSTAYNQPGFYDYYRGYCGLECLTIPIKASLGSDVGGNSAQILKLLNYNFLSDLDIDKNPKILENFDKVILLHNEYVTKKEFVAITSHPNVIYLYPNALYAEISVDYDANTITLVRGHGYPEKNIANGFDWEFENTNPYEYDRACDNWEFYEIDNGKMLNCYPEEQIYENSSLLKAIKEI
jgi:hypothetical protein